MVDAVRLDREQRLGIERGQFGPVHVAGRVAAGRAGDGARLDEIERGEEGRRHGVAAQRGRGMQPVVAIAVIEVQDDRAGRRRLPGQACRDEIVGRDHGAAHRAQRREMALERRGVDGDVVRPPQPA